MEGWKRSREGEKGNERSLAVFELVIETNCRRREQPLLSLVSLHRLPQENCYMLNESIWWVRAITHARLARKPRKTTSSPLPPAFTNFLCQLWSQISIDPASFIILFPRHIERAWLRSREKFYLTRIFVIFKCILFIKKLLKCFSKSVSIYRIYFKIIDEKSVILNLEKWRWKRVNQNWNCF